MTTFTESEVEAATLEWLESLGWMVSHGPNIAPHAADTERADYSEIVLEQRLRDALARLNPALPADALDDAFRKLTRPDGSTLEARNRAFHRMLVDGVTVEYRTAAAPYAEPKSPSSTTRTPPTTTGWRSTSSPSSTASTSGGRTSCCSSTAFRWV